MFLAILDSAQRRSLTLKSWEIAQFFARNFRCLSRPWELSFYVMLQFISLPKTVFGRVEVLSSQTEEPQNEKVAHLYRSTRLKLVFLATW